MGQNLSQSWGLIAERLFVDEADIANSPTQNFGDRVMAGDIKYKDINNDGQITEADKVPIGYPTTVSYTHLTLLTMTRIHYLPMLYYQLLQTTIGPKPTEIFMLSGLV